MNAEEQESAKTKPRLNIPAGALVIIPLRNRVLFPSMMMPLSVNRSEERRVGKECRL